MAAGKCSTPRMPPAIARASVSDRERSVTRVSNERVPNGGE
jgi:hypothetical protein